MSLDKKYRILICPHEIGGQMQLMAQELRRRGYYATSASYVQDWLGYVNDVSIDLKATGRLRTHIRKLLFTAWAVDQYDVFHFFWGSSLFGIRQFPHLDLRILKRFGKKIFVHFRGSDIIDQSYYDYLRAKTAGHKVVEPPISRPDQIKSLQLWRRYADRLLVSGPGLLRVVPEAVIVPQTINVTDWEFCRSPMESRSNSLIRILHAPTSRRTKGTEFVMQSVDDLKRLNYKVELVLVENVPAFQVKELYRSCDLAIDQLLYGWYGKFSVELMAMGKPVVCYLNDDWVRHCPGLPIINANPANLTKKLIELVENADWRRDVGSQGQAYVRKVHDVKRIIDDCLKLYDEAF